MTQKQLTVQTTIEGARRLQSLIAGVNSSSLGTAENTANEAKSGAVIVQIIDDIEPDDLQPHDAKLIEINGADFAPVPQTTVKIRNLTGGMLSAEAYQVAMPVSRWGLCVTGHQRNRQAILLEDLPAAVNTKRDPSTAQAVVLKRKANGDLTETPLVLTVVNRFKNISIDEGTYIKIEYIDGEWQPYAADCPGGSSSSESLEITQSLGDPEPESP